MEDQRARELLAAERERVEVELANLRREGSEESDANREPGDIGSEDLYQDEFDAGRARDLERKLEAVERAEQRLTNGTYGRSVRSGEPIPDGRLEANPTAELTIEEARGGSG
ncbi:MAG: TraR/DksA family transcriptional regulator [Solirubrobacterales bacterium]